ncbi:glycosyltransferase [Hymenobacter sp. H14-R3]|uniref:glycosyltransferase n=1 Tax=Hymenobacter sp. H14-R3 TaxID=3046308 RepID=UPI0024B9D875|nr:glycosyltransferase [Hymenobacter sp. H14-R3]MDJ0367184.1 glycosyltransferase [Hymenobacter sp. H14-R3]
MNNLLLTVAPAAPPAPAPAAPGGPPRKVLHILHALRFSGAEIMLRVAAADFRAQGLELHILSDSPPAASDYAATLEAAGYTVHYLPYAAGQRPDMPALRRFLRQHRFAVVHNHTEQDFFWYGLAARQAGVPRFVHTVHNNFNFKGLVRAKRATLRLLARRLLGVRFVAIGAAVQATERRVCFNPTTLVPNWTDTTRFFPARSAAERTQARQALGLAPGQLVLVSVGSCIESKNHHAIFTALSLLPPTVAARVVYLHVGDGHLHAAEQAYAATLNLRAEVRFLGQLQDIRSVLIASDIYLMTSHFEGLSISLLEAQQCAVPAVAYDAPGLRELVRDHHTGRLVAPQPGALATALAELAAAPQLRAQLGQAGYQQAQQQFSLTRSLRRLLALYAPGQYAEGSS